MSKNFTAKTSPKWILWSVITAVIVVIGVVIMAIFGVNNAVHTQSTQKLVVNVQMAKTFYEEERDDIEAICEKAIEDAGLTALAVSYDDVSTSEHELVYSFDFDADLTALKDALQAELREAYPDQDFATTMSYRQSVLENLPGGRTGFLVRNVLAGAVMAVIVFAYVSLRYKLWNGITTFVSAVATAAIACSLVVVTRVVITASVMYGVLFAMLVSIVLSVLFAAKAEAAEKQNGALTDAEAVSEAVPVCDTVKLCGGIAAALLVVGGVFSRGWRQPAQQAGPVAGKEVGQPEAHHSGCCPGRSAGNRPFSVPLFPAAHFVGWRSGLYFPGKYVCPQPG